MTTKELQATPKQAVRELWKRGKLNFLLHSKQKEIKRDLLLRKKRINVILCARRFGKTYMLLNMAIEVCVNKKNAIVKYICPEKSQGVDNLQEAMDVLIENCPEDLKPTWKEAKSRYIFPNGSQIQVAGTDNKNYNKIRGGRSDMCIVDEAGFCSDLKTVVQSVLFPTTFTTNGKIYLVSTPSEIPTHPFMNLYVKPARSQGILVIYTIHDNPMLTPELIEEIKSEYPEGEHDIDYKRECLCEIIFDETKMIIKEFVDLKDEIVTEWERPSYFDAYTSGDVGFRHLTAYLIGYWDFLNQTLVIEDEIIMNGPSMTTEILAGAVKQKELEHWEEKAGTIFRVMDNDLRMINDLNVTHGLTFLATEKHNKDAHVNHVKMMVRNKQIRIHPRCKHLIYHLENGTWKDTNSMTTSREFAEIEDSIDGTIKGGHADTVDALIYMVRNLIKQKDPYPEGYGTLSGSNVFKSRVKKDTDSDFTRSIKKILNIKERVKPSVLGKSKDSF